MGWAKYYEDNVSIYVGRMAVADTNLVHYVKTFEGYEYHQPQKQPEIQSQMLIPKKMENGRRGLELRFEAELEPNMSRRLQMNGWWWSKSKACWCNLNNYVNRRFIQNSFGKYKPRIKTVACVA